MEALRRRFADDPRFLDVTRPQPIQPRKPSQTISVASTSSESSVVERSNKPRSKPIVVSSDDSDGDVVVAQPYKPSQPSYNVQKAVIKPPSFNPSYPPKVKDTFPQPKLSGYQDAIAVPTGFGAEYQYMPPNETETALKDLVGNSMNEDVEVVVNMDDAIVDGFRDGVKLLAHQVIGRKWMTDRENTSKKCFGGILADDMGLGKTIQTLARIVEGEATKEDRKAGSSGCTLVVCPLALVGQWASEIEKMTFLKVLKHQGTGRTADPSVLKKYNVVVTTYDTVKSEYGVYAPGLPANAPATAKKGKSKSVSDDSDSDSDSDSIAAIKAKKSSASKSKAKKKCAIYGVKWLRVVLDEAHNIKNVKTKGAIACCELDTKFRWCLTGTPMQNNVVELYSLMKFLRIKPYSEWATFNEQVGQPITSGRGAGLAMKRLQVILKQIMLRRRKLDTVNGKALIDLPKRTVEVISCPFDGTEKVFYQALESKMEVALDKIMKANSKAQNNNYFSVLLLLLRLRQACNHPLLVSKDYKKDVEAIESAPKTKEDEGEDADDLVAAFNQMGVTRKCHLCNVDIDDSSSGEGEWRNHCRGCISLAKTAKQAELDMPSSAKIRMILKLLEDVDERSNSEEKTIIFSQFTSMMDLIQPFLKERGIKFTRYDGSMQAKDREAALETIKNSKTIRVILLSFKAGNTGLNLTSCNNVILVDLWWNPALEEQAFDRAHRFGQTRDVNIYKLKIDGTVEDRILELQEKKRTLAQAALSGDKIKNMRLGMDDLLALFRPGARDADDDSDDDLHFRRKL
ncbi:hypothetical protein FA15DRAFT_610100 [Coprinopsis marcescibilis]|uniref:Uncharacterized protein n=1 Tax=Coprinopsis marcescibilis TaxID=230819 RepID=A0A5C3LA55_COPMA|nr:hypothetical protein FA15DRAFT_610100 [Coprinopsis marcescibilis]